MANRVYDHQSIEQKWVERWKEEKVYEVDIQNAEKPFYNLWMFPYPSGARMHVGHAYASTGSDIYGRFMRMQGYDVFQPMGFDAFGIHGENYAIKVGEHPWGLMEDLCNRFRDEQFYRIGHGYDWEKEVRTHWPEYYKWTQWIFIQLYKHGLAERKTAKVNWCPSCKTVLADEQVIAGECERCHNEVLKKELEQWFFKITKFADQLNQNLDQIDWSKHVVESQRNWIGRSEGLMEKWPIDGMELELQSFTTWPHTTWGATFMAIAPEHPIIDELVSGTEYEEDAKQFVDEIAKDRMRDPDAADKEKKGFFTGRYAINHLAGHKMPIYIANFAIMEYGSGIVKCTPTHDQRDFEFAKKYDLPMIVVVHPRDEKLDPATMTEAYTGPGVMSENTGPFEGMADDEARYAVAEYSIEKGSGYRAVEYHLRDWLISRQRYWSAPIPMIHCKECGVVPVPEEDLPVELPYVEDWQPKGDGRGPLASIPEFVDVECPSCGGAAERETDTIDNFLDSGWYFFRYPFVNRADVPFAATGIKGADDERPDSKAFQKWFPVHLYVGGAEHAVLHLMYTRFLTMAFQKMGFIDFDEPFVRFFAHGHITKDGKKMSKSLGNIVNPDEYIETVGADVFRTYLMFLGPFDQGGDFNDDGMSGVVRFINRIVELAKRDQTISKPDKIAQKKLHQTIKKVTEDIQAMKLNTAIAALMELVNVWGQYPLAKDDVAQVIKLIAPFAPFISEELWQEYYATTDGFASVHHATWPEYDPTQIIEDTLSIPVQVNGKLRGVINIPQDVAEDQDRVISLSQQEEKVAKYLAQGAIIKEIYIPKKLVNFVVRIPDDRFDTS